MNPLPTPAIYQSLRGLLVTYLDHLRSLLVILQQDFMLDPYPDDPTKLPAAFPHGEFVHLKHIDWFENGARHVWLTRFTHDIPSNNASPFVWELCAQRFASADASQRIGYVEIDSRVYADHPPNLEITSVFIVQAMRDSVQMKTGIHISSRVLDANSHFQTIPSLNLRLTMHPGVPSRGPIPAVTSPYNVELIEMRTTSGTLIRELARRDVARRPCTVCQRWLPPSGPQACFEHHGYQ